MIQVAGASVVENAVFNSREKETRRMSKQLKFIVALAVAGSLLVGAQARAASVTAVISDILDDMEGNDGIVNHLNAIVFEDDDFSQFVDVNGGGFGHIGDVVRGIIDFPNIWAANPQDDLDPRNVGKSAILTPARTLGTGGGVDAAPNELTGAFEFEIIGYLPGVDGILATADDVLQMGPVAVASRTLLKSLVAGTMIEMFEDGADNFSAAGVSLAVDAATAQDGTLFAELGITTGVSEFYTITPVGAFGIDEAIEFALNFTVAPPALIAPWNPPTMEPWVNSLGTKTYGFGTLTASGTSGTIYDRASDVDTIILYAPVPAAVGPGAALLGALGLLYRRRRRA